MAKHTAKVGAGLPLEQLTTAHFWSWLNKQAREYSSRKTTFFVVNGDTLAEMWLKDIGFLSVCQGFEMLEVDGVRYFTWGLYEISIYLSPDSEELPVGTELTLGEVLRVASGYLPKNEPIIEGLLGW